MKKTKIWPITKKEFLHIVRDTRTLLITFALPVVMLILYGYALTFDIKNIPVVLRDMDNKPLTRQLVEKFKSSGYFVVAARTDSFASAEKYFLSGKANMIINIDQGFSGRVLSGRTSELQIIVDGSDANTAVVSINYINGILRDFSKNIILKTIRTSAGVNSRAGADELFPINAKPRVWYNPELKSMNFLVPGIISMVLMILGGLITSLSIVGEKAKGTMEQLIATSIKPYELMIGKLLPYVLIGFCDVLLCVGVSVIVFNVPIKGSIFLLFVESAIFMFGVLGMGMLISTLADRQENAIILGAFTTMLPSLLLSGFMFPIENMPKIIQAVTYLVPARYFFTILRGIFLKGIGIAYLWPDTLMLCLFGVLMVFLASRGFKRTLD